MRKKNTILNISLLAFFLAGIVLVAISGSMAFRRFVSPDVNDIAVYTYNFIIFMIVFAIMGIVCIGVSLFAFFRFAMDSNVKGQKVEGTIIGYEKNDRIEMNGASPYRVTGTFVCPFTNMEKNFVSSNIWESEEWFRNNMKAGDKVDVIVKNKNKYKVDIDSILRKKGIIEL